MSANWLVQGAGVDYVTMTANTPATILWLKRYADAQFAMLEADGFHVKPSKPMGYDGWQCGPVFGGARVDGYMLRVSGQAANEAFGLWHEDIHITRLDVQATLKSIPGQPEWGKWSIAMAEANQSARPRRGGYPHARLEDGRGKGDTVKVGSRTSDRYGRLYDKEMESLSPEYEGCWRYEIEYKGDYAVMAARHLRAASSLTSAAGALALAEYRNWQFDVPGVSLEDARPLAIDEPKSDVDRQKSWLRRNVGPTILRLLVGGEHAFVDNWIAELYSKGRG